MSEYGYTVEVAAGYDEAVLRARSAFKAEGFSILSEMHVGGMLGPDAGDERQYLIMGMWNGSVTDRHLAPDVRLAVHLPCNLVVQETGATAFVAALDPEDAAEPGSTDPSAASEAAREALARVLEKVAEGSIA